VEKNGISLFKETNGYGLGVSREYISCTTGTGAVQRADDISMKRVLYI